MVIVENLERKFHAKAQNNQNQNLTNRSFAPLHDEYVILPDLQVCLYYCLSPGMEKGNSFVCGQ